MKILLLLFFCLIAQRALADDSLVGHWQLDEGAGFVAQDRSPAGSSDGQLMNGPTWVVDGVIGGGLLFDGLNDYIEVGNPPDLQLTSSMSIALWMYAERLSPETDVLIAKTGGFGDVGWYLYIEGGYPAMKIGHPNPFSKTSTRTSTIHVSLRQWYHVAGVYNAGNKTLDMYVNGVLTNGLLNGLVPSSQRNSGQNINIARRTNNRRHFKGILDDIRIYSRALSPQEMVALAQGSEPPQDGPPLSNIYEAEHAVLLSPFTVASDPAANSGAYIAATIGKSTKAPKREGTLAFTIPSDGTYYLWARLKALSGQSDAIYIGIDQSWDRVYPKVKNSYQWVGVKTSVGSSEYGFSLAEGEHVFQVGHAEIGARLDALFLTNDFSEIPN